MYLIIGQVRSDLRRFLCSGQEKKGGGGCGVRGGGGGACTGRYKGVQAVRPESVACRGCFEVLWNLKCPVGYFAEMCSYDFMHIAK